MVHLLASKHAPGTKGMNFLFIAYNRNPIKCFIPDTPFVWPSRVNLFSETLMGDQLLHFKVSLETRPSETPIMMFYFPICVGMVLTFTAFKQHSMPTIWYKSCEHQSHNSVQWKNSNITRISLIRNAIFFLRQMFWSFVYALN